MAMNKVENWTKMKRWTRLKIEAKLKMYKTKMWIEQN